MTLKLWRPDRVDWGNRWPAEEALNRFRTEGWCILTILPADPWSGEVPTVVLARPGRWRDPMRAAPWQRLRFWCWYYVGRRLGVS